MKCEGCVRMELLKAWHDAIDLEFLIYLMVFQFHFCLSLFHALHFMSILVYIFCSVCDLSAFMSYREDPSHGFLVNRWLVQSRFVGLDNLLEAIVHHHLLIRGITGLEYRDEFSMVSTLVCMVTYWTGLMVSHDLRLSSIRDLTKLLHCVVSQPWENIEACAKVSNDFDLWVRS